MVIDQNSILYFSGTGNTYDIATKVAKQCGCQLINIASLMKKDVVEINCEKLGIAFPIYYGGIPKLMREIISKIKCLRRPYIFALATYGGMPANPFKSLERRLQEKHLNLAAGFLFNMPGNYLPLNGARKDSVQIKAFKKADKKIEKVTEMIRAKETMKYEKSPYIIDRPFDRLCEKRVEGLSVLDANFKVDSQCNQCGICLKICPVNNIIMEVGSVKWLGNCEQCMACIQYCPKEAIQYSNKTYKKKRYHNPNVDYLKELLIRDRM